MGEFKVHHVRFFEYEPKAIQCMTYNQENQQLALSRSDGHIELWSVADNWYQEKIIPGGEGQSVEAIVWQGPRLFTAGLDSNVREIDLVRLQPKCMCSSNAGPVWCLTSNSNKTRLAAGTEDGCVVLLSTEYDQLEYSMRFESQESRILSIAWHQTEDVIVTGGIDNIRLWSATSGRALQRLTLGRQERNKETVVWCVAILSDMTIVSGDSRGKTSFWNGKQGTIIKSIQSHKADVNCLAVSPSETSVVASGVDPAIVRFDYIAPRENSDWKDWIGAFVHGHHSHDVRAVQIVNNQIISGGVDTTILHFKQKKILKKYRSIPHRPLVKVAREVNVMLLQYPTYLEVWRLGYTDESGSNGEILPLRSNPIKLIQLKIKGGNPVYCCDISQDATLLAYSDCDTVRLYQIKIVNLQSIQPSVSMKRVPVHSEHPPDGAHCMCFTADGQKLVTVTSSSRLQISRVTADGLDTEYTFPRKSDCFHLLTLSADDKLAAVADHTGSTYIYNLVTQQHICSTPQHSNQVTAMSFSPDGATLALAYTNLKIFEYDVEEREYTDWSKRWSQRFMTAWTRRSAVITYLAYNPSNPDQLVIQDSQMFCLLDKTLPFPDVDSWSNLCKLRENNPFHVCLKYKYLMHLEVLPDNWLVAVERPPLEMYGNLPDALRKKKFGT